MTRIKWAVAALVIAGLASPIASADAKSHKHHKSQSSAMTDTSKNKSTAATGTNKSPGTTTGANTKSSSGNPSSQGKTP